MTDSPAPAPSLQRIPAIDMLRGAALLAMFVYHLAWDAHYFGLSGTDPSASFGWKVVSHTIASAFLFLAGVSLVLAQHRPVPQKLHRLLPLAAACAAVSLVTWLAVPEAFIAFGILHCILAASLLALPLLRTPLLVLVIVALAMLLAPWWFASPAFDTPWLSWTGLNQTPPRTLDYRPLLPFAAALFAGVIACTAGQAALQKLRLASKNPALLGLAYAGRHSLAIYLLHQPVFLAFLYAVTALLPVQQHLDAAPFMASCQTSCRDSGQATAVCLASCSCVVEELQAAGLWAATQANRLDAAGTDRLRRMAQACRSNAAPP